MLLTLPSTGQLMGEKSRNEKAKKGLLMGKEKEDEKAKKGILMGNERKTEKVKARVLVQINGALARHHFGVVESLEGHIAEQSFRFLQCMRLLPQSEEIENLHLTFVVAWNGMKRLTMLEQTDEGALSFMATLMVDITLRGIEEVIRSDKLDLDLDLLYDLRRLLKNIKPPQLHRSSSDLASLEKTLESLQESLPDDYLLGTADVQSMLRGLAAVPGSRIDKSRERLQVAGLIGMGVKIYNLALSIVEASIDNENLPDLVRVGYVITSFLEKSKTIEDLWREIHQKIESREVRREDVRELAILIMIKSIEAICELDRAGKFSDDWYDLKSLQHMDILFNMSIITISQLDKIDDILKSKETLEALDTIEACAVYLDRETEQFGNVWGWMKKLKTSMQNIGGV